MSNRHDLSHSEKELLTTIGRHPQLPIKELVNCTPYRRIGTILRKLDQFKEQRIIWGPIYDVNYSKLCRNPLHKVACTIETDQSSRTVMPYLMLIESLSWKTPVLSPQKNVLNVGFFSSNDTELKALLQLLKDRGIITDYTFRVYCSKRIIENPNFLGDIAPSLDNLLDPCDIPDMSLRCYDTEWNKCDIAILPYLGTGYRSEKLIEILKAEKNLNRTWTYEQIKYSRRKMLENELIEKKYIILPFRGYENSIFSLFLKVENRDLAQRILCNFTKGGRAFKEYVLFEDGGLVHSICHHTILADLMHNLDQIEEIKAKEIHYLRSITGTTPLFLPPEVKYFDFDSQTLEYPYHECREKIKEHLESEGG